MGVPATLMMLGLSVLLLVVQGATNEELQQTVNELREELKLVKTEELKHDWALQQVKEKLLNTTKAIPTPAPPTTGFFEPFHFCPVTSVWFVFLCAMLGGCLVVIGSDILMLMCEGDDDEEDDHVSAPLAAQDQIAMFDRAMTCNFLNVFRTLENWQASDCFPPPSAAVHFRKGPNIGDVDPTKKAVLRASYEFTLYNLGHWKRITATVLVNQNVWLKAWVASSFSGILAYVAQDGVYRGDEKMQRILQGIWTMAGSLTFITMLLLTNYTFATVSRWHRVLTNAITVQGKLSNLACLIGNDLKGDPDRRIAYTFYRYLNLVHIFTYRNVRTDSKQFVFDFEDLEHSGLLEGKNERQALEQGGRNSRDIVICWVGKLLNECYRTGRLNPSYSNDTMVQLTGLRGSTGGFLDSLNEQEPSSWASLMIIVTHMQMVFFSVGFAGVYTHLDPNPIIGFGDSGHGGPMHHVVCDSPNTAISSFITVLIFAFLLEMCEVMREPFGSDFDDINAEIVLHNTDKSLFHYLHGGHMDITLADGNMDAN